MIRWFIFGLLLLSTFFNAFGALAIKKGTSGRKFLDLWKSKFLWIGGGMYGISTIMYLFVLRYEALSLVYPLVSLTYIWTTMLSVWVLKEKMNKWKWIGLFGILIGVFFIGLGSS